MWTLGFCKRGIGRANEDVHKIASLIIINLVFFEIEMIKMVADGKRNPICEIFDAFRELVLDQSGSSIRRESVCLK